MKAPSCQTRRVLAVIPLFSGDGSASAFVCRQPVSGACSLSLARSQDGKERLKTALVRLFFFRTKKNLSVKVMRRLSQVDGGGRRARTKSGARKAVNLLHSGGRCALSPFLSRPQAPLQMPYMEC